MTEQGIQPDRKSKLQIQDLTEALMHASHVHRWEILDVYGPQPYRPVHPRMAHDPSTIVLLRCTECNLPETIDLDGQWTLEQVRGQTSEKPASDDQ